MQPDWSHHRSEGSRWWSEVYIPMSYEWDEQDEYLGSGAATAVRCSKKLQNTRGISLMCSKCGDGKQIRPNRPDRSWTLIEWPCRYCESTLLGTRRNRVSRGMKDASGWKASFRDDTRIAVSKRLMTCAVSEGSRLWSTAYFIVGGQSWRRG